MGHRSHNHSDDATSPDDITHNNPVIFMQAIQEIVNNVVIDATFDIPYVCGASRSIYVYYRDRHMPAIWNYRGRDQSVDPPLICHEWVEALVEIKGGQARDAYKSHMYANTHDEKYVLGSDTTFAYKLSHQLAQHLERYTIIYQVTDGVEPSDDEADTIWRDWSTFCDQWVKEAGSERITRCPGDLYLQPYEDQDPDLKLLQQMADAGAPKSYLLYDVGQIGGSDGKPFYQGG